MKRRKFVIIEVVETDQDGWIDHDRTPVRHVGAIRHAYEVPQDGKTCIDLARLLDAFATTVGAKQIRSMV